MHKIFISLLVKFLLVGFVLAGANSYAAQFQLFTTAKHKPPAQFNTLQPYSIGSIQPVPLPQYIGTAIYTSSQLKTVAVGDVLTFHNYRIIVDETKVHSNGDISLIGNIENSDKLAVITRGNSGSSGVIYTDDGVYYIKQGKFGERLITPSDRSGVIMMPIDEGGIVPSINSAEEQLIRQMKQIKLAPGLSADTTATATIDVMIFWDSAFTATYTAPQTKLNNLIAISNKAFKDSDIYITINLVHSEQIDQPSEVSNYSTLMSITNNTGVFNKVATLREKHNADLVGILRKYRNPEHGNCGAAWRNGNRGLMPNFYKRRGFFVVSYGEDSTTNTKCADTTLAHEIGHNLGSNHDHSVGEIMPIFPYSYGHDDDGKSFATIMSYDISLTVEPTKFSNPNKTCAGSPCGVSGTGVDAADNAKGFNQIRFDVAGFYSKESIPDTPSTIMADDRNQGINLSWGEIDSANYYRLYRANWPNPSYRQIYAGEVTNYRDTEISTSTIYYYTLKACASNEITTCSGYSNIIEAYYGIYLTATVQSTKQVNLLWPVVSGADYYRLERELLEGAEEIYAGNDTNYHDIGLSSNSKYDYRLRVCIDSNINTCSSVLKYSTVSTHPDPPLTPTVAVQSASAIKLQWHSVTRTYDIRFDEFSSDEIYYRLYSSYSSSPNYAQIYGGTNTKYIDTELTPYIAYYYKLKVCNGGSDNTCSNYSPIQTVAAFTLDLSDQTTDIQDATIIIKYLFGGRGTSIIDNENMDNINPAEVGEKVSRGISSKLLDLDCSGKPDSKDGTLLLRYILNPEITDTELVKNQSNSLGSIVKDNIENLRAQRQITCP